MKVVVTGGAGFIGSTYVRGLLRGIYGGFDVDRVVVLDKFTYAGNRANLAPVERDGRLSVIAGDVCDVETLRKVLPGSDLVVHFAAESHVDRSIAGPAPFARSNVLGTAALLHAACEANVAKFVHVSTDEVYGSIDHGSWTEISPLDPHSPYSATKAGADLLALAFYRTHGLNVSLTRCSNNYGPYQYPEKLIPLFVTNILDRQPVPLYGDGLNVREWLHVDDHCRAVHLIAQHGAPGQVYNIGNGTEFTNAAVVHVILRALDRDWSWVRHVPDRKGHDRRYSLDSTKIAALGFRPQVPFEKGIAATIRWYAENRAWWEPLKRRRASVVDPFAPSSRAR